jgi:type IV secretory pathway VirB10-like protein
MSFSDSDWTRDPPAPSGLPQTQRRALMLAAAIAITCVAIALAVYGILQLIDAAARGDIAQRAGDAPAVAASAAPAAARSPAPEPAAAVPSAPAASKPEARSESEVDAQQLAALEAEMRQRARETAQQSAAEAVRRKERAWERYYQRPAFCADNPTGAQMVQCANHHIRARREFEERYAAGKL